MVSIKSLVYKTKLALEEGIQRNELLEAAIKECNKDLRNLNGSLKIASSSSMKSSISSIICLLVSFRTKMKLLRLKEGSGYKRDNLNRGRYISTRIRWINLESAFKSRIRTAVIVNLIHKDPKTFLSDCYKLFHSKINNLLKGESALKINAVFCGEFKIMKNENELKELKYLNTKNFKLYRDTNLKEWYEKNIVDCILKDLDEFQERDSGWALSSIVNLAININKYTLQLGSSFIKLPHQIACKKACVNVQNNDNECFKWAVLSALHPVDNNPERVIKYQRYSNELNFTRIQFPMTVKQIPR